MLHFLIISLSAIAILASAVAAAESDDSTIVLNDSAIAMLTDARCAEIKTDSTSEITCFLSFPDTVPNLFYEVNPSTGQLIIKLLNTKTGGAVVPGKIDTVNQGPVTTMVTHEEILNKNETMTSLTPEWYSVVLVTLNLHPMIRRQEDVVVSEMENAITISFPWPDAPKERNKYYTLINKPRRKVLIASLIGIGTAGAAAGGYVVYKRYYRQPDAAKPLEPVLPDHPSAP